jgi:hypothetical protein
MVSNALAQEAVGAFWTQFPLVRLKFPPRNTPENISVHRYTFTIIVNKGLNTCIYDPVQVFWNTTSNYEDALGINPSECSIGFSLSADKSDKSPRLVTAAPITHQQQDFSIHRKELISDSGQASLHCLLNEDHCQLSVEEIRVDSNSVDEDGNTVRKILLSFSVATNEPNLSTALKINDLLEFSPQLGGGGYGAAMGEWIEAHMLSISVHTCIHTFIHAFIHTYNYAHMHTFMHAYIHIFMTYLSRSKSNSRCMLVLDV